MYNESLKRSFIDQSDSLSTKKLLYRIFRCTAPVEEHHDEDLYAMPVEHLQEAFHTVSGVRSASIATRYYLLNSYIKFCKSSGFKVSDAINSLNLDELDKLRLRMIGSPIQLARTLDIIFPESQDNEIEYVYRAYLWLAFCGVLEDEAIALTRDDILTEPWGVRIANGDIRYLYPEAVPCVMQAMTLTQMRERRKGRVRMTDRISGNHILRGKTTPDDRMEDYLLQTIRPSISRATKAAAEGFENREKPVWFAYEIGFRGVYASGVFYRMYERERVGLPVDFSEEAIHQITSKRGDASAFDKLKWETTYRLNLDYSRWKSVYAP